MLTLTSQLHYLADLICNYSFVTVYVEHYTQHKELFSAFQNNLNAVAAHSMNIYDCVTLQIWLQLSRQFILLALVYFYQIAELILLGISFAQFYELFISVILWAISLPLHFKKPTRMQASSFFLTCTRYTTTFVSQCYRK